MYRGDMTAAFPVWKTTKAILAYCWRQRDLVVKYAALPVSFMLLMECVGILAGIDTRKNPMWQFATTMVSLLLYAPFIVTWFRSIAHNEAQARMRPIVAFTPLEKNVVLINIQIAVFLIIVTIVLAIVLGIGIYVFSLMGQAASRVGTIVLGLPVIFYWFLILTRVSLALAYAAAGEPIGLRRAYDISAPIGLSMTLIHLVLVIIAGAPAAIIAVMWELLPHTNAGPWQVLGEAVINTGFGILYLLFVTSLFALVYRQLKARGIS
jgi:hypothetical protein